MKIFIDKSSKKTTVDLIHESFTIITDDDSEYAIKLSLEKWYREKTMEKVKERIQHYEGYFKDKVLDIRVKQQKNRWASCTWDNRILFNWRCVMAPEYILDYIVVHEMCHFKHKNHSKEFWNSVESVLPDYKLRKEWLKLNGFKMDIY